MKFFITKTGLLTIFILSVLSVSVFADLYQDGFQNGLDIGKASCPSDRYNEGIKVGEASCTSDRYDEGIKVGEASCPSDRYNEGIEECKTEPQDHNLMTFTDAENKVKIAIKECLSDLESCITNDPELTTIVLNAINVRCDVDLEQCVTDINIIKDYCESNKIVCGINTNGTYDDGIIVGKRECTDDPSTCFRGMVNNIISNPNIACENQNCVYTSDKKLFLPIISNKDGIPIVKDVEMDWLQNTNDANITPLIFAYNFKSENKIKNTVTLTVTKPNNGTILSNPTGINCSINKNNCDQVYEVNTEVELFAVPSDSSLIFTKWNGSECEGTINPLILAMSGNIENCEAIFDDVIGNTSPLSSVTQSSFKLTLEIVGNGTGNVKEDNSNFGCSQNCYKNYDSNEQITLNATATSNSQFEQWTGGNECDGETEPKIIITMPNEDLTCKAEFNPKIISNNLTVIVDQESGTVTSNPEGINCTKNGTECTKNYSKTVILMAKPEINFDRWDENCGVVSNNSSTTITVDMSKDKICKAIFKE